MGCPSVNGVRKIQLQKQTAELMNSEDSAFEEPVQREKESYIEISAHGMTLKITENTASPLIAKVLGVLAHVE